MVRFSGRKIKGNITYSELPDVFRVFRRILPVVVCAKARRIRLFGVLPKYADFALSRLNYGPIVR
jgi:hypothetical protein